MRGRWARGREARRVICYPQVWRDAKHLSIPTVCPGEYNRRLLSSKPAITNIINMSAVFFFKSKFEQSSSNLLEMKNLIAVVLLLGFVSTGKVACCIASK